MSSPQVFRALGLSVGLSYISLGSLYVVAPDTMAGLLGLSSSQSIGSSSPKRSITTGQPLDQISPSDAVESDARVSWALGLLAARDVTIGTAISTFWYLEDVRGMSVCILSGMILCVVDVWAVTKIKGVRDGLLLGAGAATWGAVGIGLLQCV